MFTLPLPSEWSLLVHWPRTPPPLTDAQIIESLERPIGQPTIREICRGKTRRLVIIDDLNRPTPSYQLLPTLLRQFQEAGIPSRSVRILVATGTHGAPGKDSVAKKVGSAAASECEIIVHNSDRQLVDLGSTSLGTPIYVNKEVVSSDYVIGIGGVYPNQTAGFGGGSKLALGVLGFRSIMHLHYRNSGAGWGCFDTGHALRRDLDQIARMINLRTVISVHINAMREVIRLTCGDPLLTHPGEVDFARKTFAVPPPGDADIVICNAYPSDLFFDIRSHERHHSTRAQRSGSIENRSGILPGGPGTPRTFSIGESPEALPAAPYRAASRNHESGGPGAEACPTPAPGVCEEKSDLALPP